MEIPPFRVYLQLYIWVTWHGGRASMGGGALVHGMWVGGHFVALFLDTLCRYVCR